MLKFRPFLSRLIPTAALVAMLPLAWGQSPKVQAIDYQAGVLNVTASAEFPAPQVEAWEGNMGPDATEIIILSFQNTQVDLTSLQRMSEQLLLQNPELKRFLLSPLSSEQKGQGGGFQIVLEIAMQPGTELFNPTISNGSNNQWLIALKKNASVVSVRANQPVSQIESPSTPASGLRTAQKTSTVKPDAKPVVQFPSSVPEAAQGSTTQTAHALQAEVAQLKALLEANLRKEESLQMQLARYDDLIREYTAETGDGHSQETVTIQNLRLSLVKLAQKLKATEKELEIQIQKNQTLSRELANLKQESKQNTVSVDNNPTLLVHLAEETVNDAPVKQPSKSIIGPAKTTVYSATTIQPVPVDSHKLPEHPGTALPTQATPKKPEKIVVIPSASSKPTPKSHAIQTATENRAKETRLLAAIQTHPKQPQAYLELSKLYTVRGDWSAAERMLTRLLRIYPTSHPGYYQLAWVYVHKKRKLEAQAALDTYRRLQPNDKQGINSLEVAVKQLASPSPHTSRKT